MTIKLKDVVGYALASQALLDTNSVAVKAYDTTVGGTWETLVFDVQFAAVEGMVSGGGMEGLNVEDTKLRNGYMNNETPILRDLTYKIKACIKAGTITDGLLSFNLGALKKSISKKDINGFHLAYTTTMARINAGGNAAALNTAGFTTAKQTSITTNHDFAWGIQNTKITLKVNISELSAANQIIVKALLASCAHIIKAVRAYAESVSNTTLMKKATQKAVLSTVTPAKPIGVRGRRIEQNQSICWLQHPTLRDDMEFTLFTETGSATVCRMDSKTGTCTAGIVLVFDIKVTLKKMEVPGTGDCIIITNTGVGYIHVAVLRIKG